MAGFNTGLSAGKDQAMSTATTIIPELDEEIRQVQTITGEKPEKIQKTLCAMLKKMRVQVSETARTRFDRVSQKARS